MDDWGDVYPHIMCGIQAVFNNIIYCAYTIQRSIHRSLIDYDNYFTLVARKTVTIANSKLIMLQKYVGYGI